MMKQMGQDVLTGVLSTGFEGRSYTYVHGEQVPDQKTEVRQGIEP